MGMWDPDDNSRLICVKVPLPAELQDCLDKLENDTASMAQLDDYQRALKSDPIEACCQRYKLNARERAELQEGSFWKENPTWCASLLRAFQMRAGATGLPSLSMDGDHSLLFEGIRKDLEVQVPWKSGSFKDQVEAVLEKHIDDSLWWQQHVLLEKEAMEAKSSVVLPAGWRRMEAGGEIFYFHEEGLSSPSEPLFDSELPPGWSKFGCRSFQGKFFYMNHTTRKTVWTLPKADDDLPPGWEKKKSRDGEKEYFMHMATGRTQMGYPCSGEIEDLPDGWEKCAPRGGGAPYYYNRNTEKSQTGPPCEGPDEDLPKGWQKCVSKSEGRAYYFHEASNTSQYDAPAGEMPPGIADDRLPAGWQKCVSRSGGRPYYFHAAEGKSQFELPVA